ncbi:MAG: hypothetical protein ACOYVJ_06865 [Nitrospirota bacterium]
MYSIFFLILIFLSILLVGILANYAISHDEARMEERRREYRRFRAVFGDHLGKTKGHEDGEDKKETDAG